MHEPERVERRAGPEELQFLSRLLSELSHSRLAQAADIMVMRIRELRAAKRENGSWEKAGVLSLQPGPYAANAPLPDGAFAF